MDFEQHGSPFREYPWPLEKLRGVLRYLRFQKIRIRAPRQFKHGTNINFARNADIRAPHFLELGDYVSFGKNFTCEVDLRVGSHVLISSNVSIIGRDHPFDDPRISVYNARRVDDSVVEIGNNVLIGFGTIIVGSARVHDGCIVGAGSVIVRDLPPNTVCAGIPAKPIRARYRDDQS